MSEWARSYATLNSISEPAEWPEVAWDLARTENVILLDVQGPDG